MLFSRLRLTRFWTTSKLFFAASQLAAFEYYSRLDYAASTAFTIINA
jgi:hypothetical protein